MDSRETDEVVGSGTSMSDGYESKAHARAAKRSIKRRFVALCGGIVLLFSGYTAVLILQSSINIVGGLGAKVTAVNYAFSMVFGIFACPLVVRLAGAKKSMIMAELGYTFYVLANAYPAEWLLMIAAVVVGCAGATFWVPVGLLFSYYGHLYHKHSKKSEMTCVREFSGIMLSVYQLNMIVGNVFVFFILHYLKSPESGTEQDNSTIYATSASPYLNHTVTSATEFDHCGANDCQDPETTQEHIEQYVPPNPVAFYVLISIFGVIMISACVLHICILPNIPMSFISGNFRSAEDEQSQSLRTAEDGLANEKPDNSNTIQKVFKDSWTAIKDISKRAIDSRQVLIYPINVYLGLIAGFLYSELTRAFASCILGVSKIGICIIVYAIAYGVVSYCCGKVMGRSGMKPVLFCAGLVDLVMYGLCCLWLPTAATSCIVYLVFIIFGCTGACWNILVSNLYAETFQENKELSFTMWSCFFCVGVTLQFAWSTLLCVRAKIYVQIGVLLISVATVGFLRRGNKKQSANVKKLLKGRSITADN